MHALAFEVKWYRSEFFKQLTLDASKSLQPLQQDGSIYLGLPHTLRGITLATVISCNMLMKYAKELQREVLKRKSFI